MKNTDLYRRQATWLEKQAIAGSRSLESLSGISVFGVMISFIVAASCSLTYEWLFDGPRLGLMPLVHATGLLSLLTPAALVYARCGNVEATQELVDAIDQAEDDATVAVPADIRRQVAQLRPAGQAAAKQLNAAEQAETKFRAKHHRAYATEQSYSSKLKNPELYEAIAPERETLAKVVADGQHRVALIIKEADTLARVCRKYNAAVGTPNYDFLVRARKAAAAAPSVDALRERSRAADYELEVSSALDNVPTAIPA